MEIVGMLQRNTQNDVHFAEIQLREACEIVYQLERKLLPSGERIQIVNSGGVNKAMFWQQRIEAQVQGC